MSIALRNDLEKLIARVTVLENWKHGESILAVDLQGILERLEKLEAQSHTHNFGRPKGKQ